MGWSVGAGEFERGPYRVKARPRDRRVVDDRRRRDALPAARGAVMHQLPALSAGPRIVGLRIDPDARQIRYPRPPRERPLRTIVVGGLAIGAHGPHVLRARAGDGEPPDVGRIAGR